jgi:DNA-binding Xre family transcriptional regulator
MGVGMITFGKLVLLLRRRKIVQKDLALMAGIRPMTLTRVLSDRNVTTDTINKLCKVLQVQPAQIMDYEPPGTTL